MKADRPNVRRASTRQAALSEESALSRNGSGLTEEIQILRALIHKASNLAEEDKSPERVLEMLTTIGRASTQLAALLRTNIKLGEGQTASLALKQAVDKMVKDGKLKL
jgi:predicted nucleic acid-binding protein